MRKIGLLPVLCLALAMWLPADARIQRSKTAVAEFKRENPCPANGAKRGTCAGWEVDHIIPLCAGGPDTTANLQWLTVIEHKKKTKLDVMKCRRDLGRHSATWQQLTTNAS